MFVTFFIKHYKIRKSFEAFPGVQLSFFGNEFYENLNRINEWRHEHLLKFKGKHFVKFMFSSPELFCNTPEAVKLILQDSFNSVTKPPRIDNYGFDMFEEMIGRTSIFMMRHGKKKELLEENKIWFNQRKTASMIFTKNNYNNFIYETFVKKSDNLLKVVKKIADSNEGIDTNDENQGAKKMNIEDKFFSITFDIIQKIFFNVDVNSVESVQDEYALLFDQSMQSLNLHVVKSVPLLFFSNVALPYPLGKLNSTSNDLGLAFRFYRSFFCQDYKNYKTATKKLNKLTMQHVKDARRDTENLAGRRDLLANFLKSHQEYSNENLCSVIHSFFLAGRDTTASSLTWLFYELSLNQNIQKNLAAEIYEKFGASSIPKIDDVSRENIPYLHACMLESLRMHPPVPENEKHNSESLTLPCGTVIPPNTHLMYSVYSLCRDADRFPDPDVFKPERWIDETDIIASPLSNGMFAMPVFQGGPRYCIGMDFAKNEIKLITARLIQKFSFELEAKEKPENIFGSLTAAMALCNDEKQTSCELNVVPKNRILH